MPIKTITKPTVKSSAPSTLSVAVKSTASQPLSSFRYKPHQSGELGKATKPNGKLTVLKDS